MKKIYILTIILCGVLSCKSNNSEQYATKRPNCKTTINNHDNSINEIYHITNKVIVKINMLGDEIISDNITDAYKKINAILYMLDPARFAAGRSRAGGRLQLQGAR